MTQLERIEMMEKLLDQASDAVAAFDEALDEFARVQEGILVLDNYYGSDEWMEDFEADEAGKLPADLKRGVLSEDALFDLLTDNKQLFVRLMELAADYVKKA